MRVLLIFGHPVGDSCHGTLHKVARDALARAGHEVDDCDLYAEGLDPVLSRARRVDHSSRDCAASVAGAHHSESGQNGASGSEVGRS